MPVLVRGLADFFLFFHDGRAFLVREGFFFWGKKIIVRGFLRIEFSENRWESLSVRGIPLGFRG